MLRIKELKKTYPGDVRALRGVDLKVPSGMFGLLGPNGAGKTTLMKIAATLLEPDSGTVEFDGRDLVEDKLGARKVLGYLPQEYGLYPTLTAEQTLNYFAKLKGVADDHERRASISALLERVNLSSEVNRKVGGFSGGMRQRLGIAQALLGRPKLIIVDEPTAGLDPEERARFHNLLSEIAGENTCVILSTHIVSDVSNLCSAMAIMRHGRIVASCGVREALKEMSSAVWEASVSRERSHELKQRLKIISSHLLEGRVRLRVYSKGERPGEEFTPADPTLEDYYFSRTSQTSQSGGA